MRPLDEQRNYVLYGNVTFRNVLQLAWWEGVRDNCPSKITAALALGFDDF
jgi:hypothetical protein